MNTLEVVSIVFHNHGGYLKLQVVIFVGYILANVLTNQISIKHIKQLGPVENRKYFGIIRSGRLTKNIAAAVRIVAQDAQSRHIHLHSNRT